MIYSSIGIIFLKIKSAITLREIIRSLLRRSSIIFTILQRRDRSIWNLFPFLSTIHREIDIPCENKSGQWTVYEPIFSTLIHKFCVSTIFVPSIYIFVELYFIILSIIIFPLIQEIQENVSARKEVKRNVERLYKFLEISKYTVYSRKKNYQFVKKYYIKI